MNLFIGWGLIWRDFYVKTSGGNENTSSGTSQVSSTTQASNGVTSTTQTVVTAQTQQQHQPQQITIQGANQQFTVIPATSLGQSLGQVGHLLRSRNWKHIEHFRVFILFCFLCVATNYSKYSRVRECSANTCWYLSFSRPRPKCYATTARISTAANFTDWFIPLNFRFTEYWNGYGTFYRYCKCTTQMLYVN